MPRKTYTREFKLQALKMMTDQGLSVAEVARRLGVTEGLPADLEDGRRGARRGRLPRARHPDPGRRRTPSAAGRGHPAQGRAGPAKKSRRVLRQPAELTYRFIADHRGECPVAWACDALGVSESGYHAWTARTPSAGEKRRDGLVAAIEVIHAEVRGRYGSPRMTAELNARGHDCSESTVAKLMREYGIRAKSPRRFVRTTDSRHGLPVAANVLDRDFDPAEPNAAWGADITYIPTGGCTWRWSRTCSAG